jgi:hypothetical protein
MSKRFDINRLRGTTTRFADVAPTPSSYNKDTRTAQAVLSVGSAVTRWFGTEKLRISKDAVVLDRLATAGILLLDSHSQASIDNALGRFTKIWVTRDSVMGEIAFNDTERGRQAEGMVARGEVRGLSVGYAVHQWRITNAEGRELDPEADRIPSDGTATFEAVRWEIYEASLVSVPADGSAMIRSMNFGSGHDRVLPGSGSKKDQARARMQARQRMTDAMSDDDGRDEHRAQRHVDPDIFGPEPITNNNPVTPKETTEMNFYGSTSTNDARRQSQLAGMEIALTQRILNARGSSLAVEYIGPKGFSLNAVREREWVADHRQQAEQYMGMNLIEAAAACIDFLPSGGRRYLTAADAPQIFERAFQTTSDFPSIFQNALNKALLTRYQLAVPTYREIAAERTFNDFRPHPQVRAGDFPMLQEVKESGELAYASTTDNNEPISVKPYGIVFSITRQMLVNDDLGAIDQILNNAGDMVLVFENQTFFSMFNSNPALNQDGLSVFHATHGNLAATGGTTGGAPSVTLIGNGRQALRNMKSISGNFINVPPSIILTGPAMETAADQMITQITPTLTTSVNPFSGRLRSVAEANITDTSWYLLADPVRVPNFVYGFLAGSSGPRTRIYEPFGVQGVKVSLEHDFGCGPIDFRGGWKNPGQ